MSLTAKRTVEMPTLMSRRVLNDYKGRGATGARLKDLYIAAVPGFGWIVQNFSGAMFPVHDPKLENCPFPQPRVFEDGKEVLSSDEIQALVNDELAELES